MGYKTKKTSRMQEFYKGPKPFIAKEEIDWSKPKKVEYNGMSAICMAYEGSFYKFMYMEEEKKGDFFCRIDKSDSFRECTGFDF